MNIMNKINRFLSLAQDDAAYTFLPTGDVFTFKHGQYLINQLRGNAKDGSVNNIYLRFHTPSGPAAYPLLGIHSGSNIFYHAKALQYRGTIDKISYTVTFRPAKHCWFWDIVLNGYAQSVDLVYGQDIGIAPESNIYTNELYTSQYLGHSIFNTKNGYIICSRQNMPADNCFPYLQQGVLGAKAVHYSTDGLQFFGLSYKENNTPESLAGNLRDKNLQYEFSYTALQTERFTLNGEKRLSFYGYFLPNHPDAITEAEYQDEIKNAFLSSSETGLCFQHINPVKIRKSFGIPFSSDSFLPEELNYFFPERALEEYQDNTLLSFFTKDHAHVVTKEKELLSERPHGTIIITPPDQDQISNSLISSTQYMYGIFNSHVVIGNTDLHKLFSTPRGFLNLMKNSGQRLYVKINGTYRLLTLPALYEMGMNYSRWYYKLETDILLITSYTSVNAPDLTLNVSSINGNSYDFILTSQLVMGINEYTNPIYFSTLEKEFCFTLQNDVYPGLHYNISLPECSFSASDDRIFYEDNVPFDESFLTLSISARSEFSVVIRGFLEEKEDIRQTTSFAIEKQKGIDYYESLINHFCLIPKSDAEQIAILNETIRWYTHNAMIHFSMPHGLEQPGGAAWGTRDICQGPIEFFLTTQRYHIVRSILLNIFSHQDFLTREWPQWFMFDRYSINPGECHGDVIFWPLKCIADYLYASGDFSILTEIIPYENGDSKDSLLAHIALALSNIIETRMIGNTGLITYAGGDWDDTLQPANDDLKQRLVSSWTVALAFQTFEALENSLKEASKKLPNFSDSAAATSLSEKLNALKLQVKNAFENILIKDGVIAGFLDCGQHYTYMIHPSDQTTGIHYRLLPMTRSIIAELADADQAERNITLIHTQLKCPDGVRLMDKPADYRGGVSHLFRRAEQAANVGREISLQYTHAHIRYIEALSKLGYASEAWDCLFTINPILIQHSVPNALIRQSNLYFSSSDGAYSDRYEYAQHFDLLKSGSIGVKGGWRLYSSGPGIYIRQLIQNVLGIRFSENGILIDPVLPPMMDGLKFCYNCFGKPFTFCYHIKSGKNTCPLKIFDGSQELDIQIQPNPYRSGAAFLSRQVLEQCGSMLDIYLYR